MGVLTARALLFGDYILGPLIFGNSHILTLGDAEVSLQDVKADVNEQFRVPVKQSAWWLLMTLGLEVLRDADGGLGSKGCRLELICINVNCKPFSFRGTSTRASCGVDSNNLPEKAAQ